MITKTFVCPKCGWYFALEAEASVFASDAYRNCSWFCPHCGSVVGPERQVKTPRGTTAEAHAEGLSGQPMRFQGRV